MKNLVLAVLFGSVLFVSCDKELNGEVQMKLDQTMSNDDIQITFETHSDSRCPEGANCIVAGYVEANLTVVELSTNAATSLQLGNDTSPYTQDTILYNYRIEYLDLTPSPVSGELIKDKDIRLDLRVTKQ